VNHEPAALDRRAAEAQPHPPARLKLDELTSDQLDRLYAELEDQRGAKQTAAGAADRFRDILCEALNHDDDNPGDDVLVAELRAHFGKTGPEPTNWRVRLAGYGAVRDQINAAARASSAPAPAQATDSTAARTARIRSLTLPASGRQLDPHLSRRLPGILHLGHRPTSLDMALIAEAADVSVDWLLHGDADESEATCNSSCADVPGIRGLLEHVGIDTRGRDITVAGRAVDPADQQPAAAWTPPPPGSTREQLPNHILDIARPHLPDYLSTACQTADVVACAACYPRSGIPRPQYDELRAHAERLHNRCRRNHKFTGQLCVCGCHPDQPKEQQ
jgi:hypothetical protein